jgi:hypothetical protein
LLFFFFLWAKPLPLCKSAPLIFFPFFLKMLLPVGEGSSYFLKA